MRTRYTLAKKLLGAALLVSLSGIASADEVKLPEANANDSAQQTPVVNVPDRGATMSKVEAKFGAPSQRETPVGKPAITRWDYPNFIVYFEGERVIHSVVK